MPIPGLMQVRQQTPARRGGYRSILDAMDDRAVRWRSLGWLYLAGGGLGLLSLSFDDPARDAGLVLALSVLAVVAGLALERLSGRLPESVMPIGLTLGTALISAAVIAGGDAGGSYSLFYVWVGIESFFFLRWRAAVVQLAGIGLAYALVIRRLAGTATGSDWLVLVGTAAVSGLLVAALRERIEGLMATLRDAGPHDVLTGLLNRRGAEEALPLELERARRTGTSLTLIVADIDRFKGVNDRFGHHAGDDALRWFADILSGATRRIDATARLGGDEFLVVAPHTSAMAAYLLAERVGAALPKWERTPLTASWGIATYPQHGETVDELLRAADQALYAAKRLGRNRSAIYHAGVAAELDAAGEDEGVHEQLAAVVTLAEALDMRDPATATHSMTVGRYARAIARELGRDPGHVERIGLAGLVHDIGKIGVPDPVLRKPGPLSDEEWEQVREHPALGARILNGANLPDLATWVLGHHERVDGGGYPGGLAGDEISLEARILAVADAYEAMTSDRPYRPGLGDEPARTELRCECGRQFDERVVNAFLRVLAQPADAPEPVAG